MTNGEKYNTVTKRHRAFYKVCCQCENSKCDRELVLDCFIEWLDDEADDELLPCPFCERAVNTHKIVDRRTWIQVQCTCGYRGGLCYSVVKAAALHNCMARAVTAAKESEAK